MSLNNLRLPDILISELYKNVIVQSQEPSETRESKKPEPVPIRYLGENRKQVSILVNYDKEVYLPEKALQFLANILKACNLNLADIAIVNISGQDFKFKTLIEQLQSKKIILFGPDATAVSGREFPAFVVTKETGYQLLNAPSLDDLNQQNDTGKLLKSKLWLCLKELFEVA